jgi:hypothetical protein
MNQKTEFRSRTVAFRFLPLIDAGEEIESADIRVDVSICSRLQSPVSCPLPPIFEAFAGCDAIGNAFGGNRPGPRCKGHPHLPVRGSHVLTCLLLIR